MTSAPPDSSKPAILAHSFVPGLHEIRPTREAATGAEKATDARLAGSFSGAYPANNVLCATVVFFANAAIKLEQRRVGLVSFVLALAVFAFAVTRVALLPL